MKIEGSLQRMMRRGAMFLFFAGVLIACDPGSASEQTPVRKLSTPIAAPAVLEALTATPLPEKQEPREPKVKLFDPKLTPLDTLPTDTELAPTFTFRNDRELPNTPDNRTSLTFMLNGIGLGEGETLKEEDVISSFGPLESGVSGDPENGKHEINVERSPHSGTTLTILFDLSWTSIPPGNYSVSIRPGILQTSGFAVNATLSGALGNSRDTQGDGDIIYIQPESKDELVPLNPDSGDQFIPDPKYY